MIFRQSLGEIPILYNRSPESGDNLCFSVEIIMSRILLIEVMREERKTVDIKSGRLFPIPFLVFGAIMFIVGLGVFANNPMVSIILLFSGFLILTAYEGTEIDLSSNTYREYHSFLFLKKGRAKEYEGIENIFVNSGKVSQRIYTAHTSSSVNFSSIEYNAYLKFTDGIKVFLVSGKNKKKLMKKLDQIARTLQTSIVDNTIPK